MASPLIRSEDELRRIVKRPPTLVVEKIRSGPLRASPSEFLLAARLAFVTLIGPDGSPRVVPCGGAPGFVSQDETDRSLLIPIHDDRRSEIADNIAERPFAGILLMIPGVRHTLRVNGAATIRREEGVLAVTPDQSYAHCAKAFIRSELWSATHPQGGSPQEPSAVTVEDRVDGATADFVRYSPFVAIGTSLLDGDADVSPRGDPPGFVQVIDDRTLFLPERPGNRIADSLRNIIAVPRASLLFLRPGDHKTLEVTGDANLTTDGDLCRAASVNGKVPKLGVIVEVKTVRLQTEPALAASDAWNPESHSAEADLPTIGALVADPNSTSTLTKRLQAAATDRLTELDYKFKLY